MVLFFLFIATVLQSSIGLPPSVRTIVSMGVSSCPGKGFSPSSRQMMYFFPHGWFELPVRVFLQHWGFRFPRVWEEIRHILSSEVYFKWHLFVQQTNWQIPHYSLLKQKPICIYSVSLLVPVMESEQRRMDGHRIMSYTLLSNQCTQLYKL